MNKIFLIFILGLLITGIASAKTFQQWNDVNLTEPVTLNGYPDSNVDCNITIFNPDHLLLEGFEPMVYYSDSGEYNYLLDSGKTGELGDYDYDIFCTNGNLNKTESFSFTITPTGNDGLLGFYFLIILLSYGVMIFGAWKHDITITLLGTLALYFVGIWVLFFGIDVFKNYLTDAFAFITIGVAAYLSIVMANEYIID